MRITLNFLDNAMDELSLEEHCQYELIQGKQFSGDFVVLDNHQFSRCSFQRSTFLYSGGPFAFVECEIDYQCSVSLTGAAARGHVLWKMLQDMPGRRLPGSG